MEYIINTLTYFSLYCKNDDNNINNNNNNLKVKKKSLLLKKSEGYKNTYNSSYLIN